MVEKICRLLRMMKKFMRNMMKPSAAGRTRRRLGNTSTCPRGAFRHITKSLSAARRTRRRPGNTSTCPQGAFLCSMSKRIYRQVLVLPSRRLVRPAADDDFVLTL